MFFKFKLVKVQHYATGSAVEPRNSWILLNTDAVDGFQEEAPGDSQIVVHLRGNFVRLWIEAKLSVVEAALRREKLL